MIFQKRHILAGLIAIIVLYLLVNGIYNYFLSEEQKVKRLLYQMASDIEEKDWLGFNEYFTKDASIRYRELEIQPDQIMPFLIVQLRKYKKLKISFSELTVEMNGNDKAVVIFAGTMLDVVQRTRGAFEGTVKLRKVEGEWKVFDAVGRQHKRPKMVF